MTSVRTFLKPDVAKNFDEKKEGSGMPRKLEEMLKLKAQQEVPRKKREPHQPTTAAEVINSIRLKPGESFKQFKRRVNVAKNESLAEIASKPKKSRSKYLDVRKEKKKEKKQKKQKKREEEREEETCMVESFAFGDVAQAPPSLLPTKPKKAPVSLVQKQADLQRLKAIEAYRLMKQKKRVGASKDDAPVYL
eukprot:CAMPEP_0184341534 /NCGR_PEP_ID=MMETSP1089-20130417/10143_1 /TAXON_ID=38269 ORGANISM="Gloeochaete wittrockiana, Strain SAG46.84" /NCGR_SAMPLE_ID=MMETSP1089 /ASSEMBLY_ACC=CAM_ASM_000445 /LENGTH=191 /DNA_ID=CAMNT_0026669875 /DNA_START=65 /DNA_END=640 /DNA_ORIENTATION=+